MINFKIMTQSRLKIKQILSQWFFLLKTNIIYICLALAIDQKKNARIMNYCSM